MIFFYPTIIIKENNNYSYLSPIFVARAARLFSITAYRGHFVGKGLSPPWRTEYKLHFIYLKHSVQWSWLCILPCTVCISPGNISPNRCLLFLPSTHSLSLLVAQAMKTPGPCRSMVSVWPGGWDLTGYSLMFGGCGATIDLKCLIIRQELCLAGDSNRRLELESSYQFLAKLIHKDQHIFKPKVLAHLENK